jgi:alkanesulfonate monooxygenase SsuD/methylene tetrahydromethanopterin reductase-like flavin-dependent oxidoreductase (luciferase family)
VPFEFAARSADVVFITPSDRDVETWIADVRNAEAAVGREGEPLRVFADVLVFLDLHGGAAAARKEQLDQLDGAEFRSDALTFTGTPVELAALLVDWQRRGIDGFRLRPGVIGHDLDAIVDHLVPLLQQQGAFRTAYADETLRGRLGLPRPISRYAVTPA